MSRLTWPDHLLKLDIWNFPHTDSASSNCPFLSGHTFYIVNLGDCRRGIFCWSCRAERARFRRCRTTCYITDTTKPNSTDIGLFLGRYLCNDCKPCRSLEVWRTTRKCPSIQPCPKILQPLRGTRIIKNKTRTKKPTNKTQQIAF